MLPGLSVWSDRITFLINPFLLFVEEVIDFLDEPQELARVLLLCGQFAKF